MNNSTKLLSLFSPPPPLYLLRGLYISRITNLRRFHCRAFPPSSSSVTSINRRSLSRLVSLPPIIPNFPIGRFYTHRAHVSAADSAPSYHHQLSEWTELLHSLSEAGYFSDSVSISGNDEFFSGFPDELFRPALACLALARDRPELLERLSRRDVEVVVENGKPFIFKTGLNSLNRMSLYLRSRQGIGKILDIDKASTVDLMRLLLSYVLDIASSEVTKHHNQEIMESSVRNLLTEIAKMSFRTPESNVQGTMQNQFSDINGQALGSFQKHIEMKRGDWICSRCSGMNFARNIKCFQCDEARPKRHLTGSEWECPQCDFYNYGRNVACLRCDCKRPMDFSLNSANSGNSTNPELERRLVENEEKAQRSSKLTQVGSDANSVDTDKDFPEIMPLRKGVNRSIVNMRKTPLERRLASAENSVDMNVDSNGNNDKALESKPNRSLNEILGSSPSSRSFKSSQVINTDFVPFVPLPSDMFAKKADKEETQRGLTNNNHMDGVSGDNQNVYQEEGQSNANLSSKETDHPKKDDKKSEEPARWFKRVTELHNISDLESMVPQEISPEKMPIRKGENRFVVSRKKDRSLTKPTYKRPEDSDFVPFVPFPPDYFAKEKQPKKTMDTIPAPATESASQVVEDKPKEPSSNNPGTMPGRIRNGKSLEGSLVKEPDLLDMSEEAKAERWFKRVAEIKNISELSEIPDEDFPSIMPMRKGVNRFVVSKRKTPLERRLASQRHRRDPQINEFDPSRKEDA